MYCGISGDHLGVLVTPQTARGKEEFSPRFLRGHNLQTPSFQTSGFQKLKKVFLSFLNNLACDSLPVVALGNQ